MSEVLFVQGLHRSGTTLLTSAVTEATGGVTTTVGHLARHIPALDSYLSALPTGGGDRGVDKLATTAATAEEYGFLLQKKTGKQALYGHPDGVRVLREHIEELAAESAGPVVLKNPWDLGGEARILADFPQARILLLRRRVADVERSVEDAIFRGAEAREYGHALGGGDPKRQRRVIWLLGKPWRRSLLLKLIGLGVRRRAYKLARTIRKLPPERVAFLAYDELRDDPRGGAAWAGHLLDPEALAKAYEAHAFAERPAPAAGGWLTEALDRRWEKAWRRARAAQARAGVIREGTSLGEARQ